MEIFDLAVAAEVEVEAEVRRGGGSRGSSKSTSTIHLCHTYKRRGPGFSNLTILVSWQGMCIKGKRIGAL